MLASIGLIMVLLYAWLFHDWRLYSNLLLQLLFAALQLYGWWLETGEAALPLETLRALPELRRYRYSPELATGTLAAGGVLGILMIAWPDQIYATYGTDSGHQNRPGQPPPSQPEIARLRRRLGRRSWRGSGRGAAK